MKRILCYGDSNTWGYTPGTGARYSQLVRWTGICQQLLGPEYLILEDGLNGRTTAFDDYSDPWLNGYKSIGYSLVAQKPLDLIVVSLGTNDLKFTGASGSGRGLDALLKLIEGFDYAYAASSKVFPQGVKILLVSPISLHPNAAGQALEYGHLRNYEQSLKFSKFYGAIAQAHGIQWLDASAYAGASPIDNVHMDPESHAALARAIADKIREMV